MEKEVQERKVIWSTTRSVLENSDKKKRINGTRKTKRWSLFERLLKLFVFSLKSTGLYKKGHFNALNIRIKSHDLSYKDLPESFHGYRILHLTDLHLDITDGVDDAIIKAIRDVEYDICFLTGDYRFATQGSFSAIIEPMRKIIESINAKDGIYATLGNHDTYMMSDVFESMGVKMLNNESLFIKNKMDKILLSGVDDVHYYYTDAAVDCLEKTNGDFKIALVHSPELYDVAARNDYRLYLCGHTHGGQICLPGRIPLVTHLHNGKEFGKGLWKVNEMYGYTSEGCGTSGIPVRFYSESEVTLFTLNKN